MGYWHDRGGAAGAITVKGRVLDAVGATIAIQASLNLPAGKL